ncbi:hypothetical protein [Botrimarina sp.]|uniref:hypothetical protein n=1 Tax=Botrimarina sp. TaxID=2795802 RepID=UPI0032EC976E
MVRSRPVSAAAACLAAVLAGALAVAEHHEDHSQSGKWFDPANCVMCKPMADKPELMHAIKWETHKLDNGAVMTAVAPKGMQDEFDAVCQKMHSKQPQPGDKLCGFCQAFGKLMREGAKVQEVDTDFGNLTLVTADDDATVEKIHEFAQRTIEETKKMEGED